MFLKFAGVQFEVFRKRKRKRKRSGKCEVGRGRSLRVFSFQCSATEGGRLGTSMLDVRCSMFKKRAVRWGTAGKGKRVAVSTSYGGLTRIRFGGSFPRAGKSRLRERGAPLSAAEFVPAAGEVKELA
jgi:uncharacterized protein YjhX (UPF0386 family)